MATIDEYWAKKLIAGDGRFMDDPRALKVLTYTNASGAKSWAVVYPGEDPMRYERSPYCANVEVIWEAK